MEWQQEMAKNMIDTLYKRSKGKKGRVALVHWHLSLWEACWKLPPNLRKKLFLHWILSKNSFTVMPKRTSLVNVNPLKSTVKTAVSVFEWPWLKNVMLILYNTHEHICSIAEGIVEWLYIWFNSIKNRIQNKTKYIILLIPTHIMEHDKTALTSVLFSSILSYKVDCSQVGKFIFKD